MTRTQYVLIPKNPWLRQEDEASDLLEGLVLNQFTNVETIAVWTEEVPAHATHDRLWMEFNGEPKDD